MKFEECYLIDAIERIQTGKTPSTKRKDFFGGNINWYTPGDLNNGKYLTKSNRKITELAIKENQATIFDPKTVLISCIGDIGKLGITNKRCSSNQQITGILPNEKITSDYLYYWFMFNRLRIADIANNAVVPIINSSRLKNLDFFYPKKLNDQNYITNLLDKADSIRKKRKETIKLADEFLRSTFLEMFGDPVLNGKKWQKDKLSNCIIGKGQNGYFAKNENYTESGTPIIWISDFIDKFYIDVKNLKKVSIKKSEIEKYKVTYGDVLFCRSSLNKDGIGKASIVPQNIYGDIVYECHIIKVPLNTELILPEFFRVLSDTPYYRNQIIKNANTATMTTISQSGVERTEIILPPKELQNKFVKIVVKTEKLKEKYQQSLEESENLFNSLMQRAFKGES